MNSYWLNICKEFKLNHDLYVMPKISYMSIYTIYDFKTSFNVLNIKIFYYNDMPHISILFVPLTVGYKKRTWVGKLSDDMMLLTILQLLNQYFIK